MLNAILLGIIQGLTEFLPVSSSGHLQIMPHLFGLDPGPLAFDVALHLGTLVAVVAYFRNDLWELATDAVGLAARPHQHTRRARTELALLAVASVPAAVFGALMADTFDTQLDDPRLAAIMLYVTAGLLIGGEALYARRNATGRIAASPRDAIAMGLAQSLAIIPGISRSGATIAAGLTTGLTRAAAARFSFLMSIPVILGAFVVELPNLSTHALAGTGYTPADVVAGSIAAAVSGYFAVRFLMRLVTNNTLHIFAWYAIALATITLAVGPTR